MAEGMEGAAIKGTDKAREADSKTGITAAEAKLRAVTRGTETAVAQPAISEALREIRFDYPPNISLQLNKAVVYEASPTAVDMVLSDASVSLETQRSVREQVYAQARAGSAAESRANGTGPWTTLWMRIQSSENPSWQMPTDIRQIRDEDKQPILEAAQAGNTQALDATRARMPITYEVAISEIARQITEQANAAGGTKLAEAQALLAKIPELKVEPVFAVRGGPTIKPELRATQLA